MFLFLFIFIALMILQDILQISFSYDSRYLAVLDSEYTLGYWSWEKNKLMATTSLDYPQNVIQILVNPHDAAQIVTLRPQELTGYRYAENSLEVERFEFDVAKVI